MEENKEVWEQNDKFKTMKKKMSYVRQQRTNEMQILVILDSSFSHKPWMSQSEHFFVIFGILGNFIW